MIESFSRRLRDAASEAEPVHYSGLEGGVSFVCGHDRIKGAWWSLWQDDVTCQKCRDWIAAPTAATKGRT